MTRSRQRELRRQSILDAAEGLIRDTLATDFPMLALAERAGISPATPYNVFGTKASILYALLTRSLDTIFFDFERVTEKMSPFDVVLFAGRAAVDFFVADPDYYRPLYHYLIGVSDRIYRPVYMERAFRYWRSALGRMLGAGLLSGEIERDTLARHMMIQFLGALDLWTQGEIDNDQFRDHILFGISGVLCGFADPADRARLQESMHAAARAMPRDFTFMPQDHDAAEAFGGG